MAIIKTHIIVSADKDVLKLKLLLDHLGSAGRNVKQYSQLWKIWQFIKKLKMKLLYVSTILFLGIHPEELNTGIQTSTCIPMLTAALFVVAKGEKNQNIHQVTNGKQNLVYTYMEYNSVIKRNELHSTR